METAILVIDDSELARQKIIDTLKETSLFSFYYEAADGIEGFELLLSRAVDVVLCDLEMPGMDGLQFLEMMSAKQELQDIPVILLTGHDDMDSKIRGLERGASDYVTKPFHPGELLARVKVQLKIKSLQDSLKKSNQLLLELSNTDPLTKLCNRRCLMESLDKEFNRGGRTRSPLSLVMVDIDHFKKINDTYGHQHGDDVLVDVAELLRGHLRQYDLAARFGGEEFALVLPQTDLAQATQIAERIRVEAAEMSFSGLLRDLRLTASLGVASFPRGNIKTVDDLIREADYALYGAKRAGRDRVRTMAE